LGHGISQHTPPDAVGIAVEAVHKLSPQFHSQNRTASSLPDPKPQHASI
jgi:hypothetical protein